MKEDEKKNRKIRISDILLLKRLLSYASAYKLMFTFIFFLMILGIFLQMSLPLISGSVIDILTTSQGQGGIFYRIIEIFDDKKPFQIIIILSSIYFLIFIVSELINYCQQLLLQKTSLNITKKIRKDLYSHINTLPIDFFNKNPIGVLVTRITNDTATLNEMYTNVILNSLRNIITLVVILVMMLLINIQLTLIVLLFIPLTFIISFIFKKFSRKAYRNVRTNIAKVNTFLSEHLGGMKIIQVFNQQKQKYNSFRNKNRDLKRSYYREMLTFSVFRPTMYLIYMLAVIFILWIGGINVLNGAITLGAVFAFYRYLTNFFTPIQELADQFNVLQSAFASSEKIFALLDEKNTIKENEDAKSIEISGKIEFKNVWFAYENDDWILKDVSFVVNPKESIAFVGATGAGKTTILKLITRDYDINKGSILIDDIDIKQIKIKNLRSQIGKMMQDVFLFSDTITNNISLNKEYISKEEVIQSAKYVNASSFINSLPNKYDEQILERGNNISAGERQLLSFARTIAHKPAVMLLDEATANIDTETENIIQHSLYKMMDVGTMLIIAHRLSTITHVDKIILLENGQIKEIGNHKQLLERRERYYELYYSQFNDTVVK